MDPVSFQIRPAVREDSATIFQLIRAIADYEKMSGEVEGNAAQVN